MQCFIRASRTRSIIHSQSEARSESNGKTRSSHSRCLTGVKTETSGVWLAPEAESLTDSSASQISNIMISCLISELIYAVDAEVEHSLDTC